MAFFVFIVSEDEEAIEACPQHRIKGAT